MYKEVRIISFLIRWYIFSRTIESIDFDGYWYSNPISDFSIPIPVSTLFALSLSFLLPIIGKLSYDTVGIFYSRGENPAFGSFLYLLAEVSSTIFVWLALSSLNAFSFITISSVSIAVSISVALVVSTIINIFVLGWISNQFGFLRGI